MQLTKPDGVITESEWYENQYIYANLKQTGLNAKKRLRS